jgi:uncharacterized protein YjbI with pentapeptide repeats
LSEDDLRELNRRGEADEHGGILIGVNLSSSVHWGGADLREAILREVDLSRAILGRADLRGANLRSAIVIGEQVVQAHSLEGATMPNGQKYEEWLKDKEGRREDDGKNSGPS